MKYLLLIIILLSSLNIFAADDEGGPTPITFFKGKTTLKNPLDLRDPFKRKSNRKKSNIISSGAKARISGIYTNVSDSIESKPVELIKIIGIITGKERRAMARIANGKDIFFIKEGMKIGPNQAEVKAILPGGVVLVEKIRNVYDQDEYLETVLPIAGE